jgi:hypothetical protein
VSVTSIGGLQASLSFVPAVQTDIGTGQAPGSFGDALAAEMPATPPPALPDFTWMTYFRAKYNSDEDVLSQKRLDAIRRRDPALADRLQAILKLPVSEQEAAIADIEMTLSKRAAETHPQDEALAAHYGNKAKIASGDSTSTFDPDNVARWI